MLINEVSWRSEGEIWTDDSSWQIGRHLKPIPKNPPCQAKEEKNLKQEVAVLSISRNELLTVDVHDVILGHVTFVTIWTIEDQLEAAVAFT